MLRTTTLCIAALFIAEASTAFATVTSATDGTGILRRDGNGGGVQLAEMGFPMWMITERDKKLCAESCGKTSKACMAAARQPASSRRQTPENGQKTQSYAGCRQQEASCRTECQRP